MPDSRIDDLSDAVEGLETLVNDLTETLHVAKGQISALERKVQSLERRLDQLALAVERKR